MNNLDKKYTDLLQDILDNGIQKTDRTGTGTISLFGRQIRHDMKTGFPLLTTKKIHWKSVVTELLWFLRGDTNIKFLIDNGCNVWNGDAYKNYVSKQTTEEVGSMNWFIEQIKTDNEFAKVWGDLGPIYGAQWRGWRVGKGIETTLKTEDGETIYESGSMYIDQISKLINELKTNPDSRRLMVNAWNVGELNQMVLPPCHYGFQVYTRELTWEEQVQCVMKNTDVEWENLYIVEEIAKDSTPKRAISLMWNQRSVDTPLGLPFNIASYGLLLEIIAKVVNMVPDELIGNLGDTHIYLNQIDGVKEQIGRKLTLDERIDYWFHTNKPNRDVVDNFDTMYPGQQQNYLDDVKIPTNIREPFPLPKLNINTEFWPTEGGECGIGNISVDRFIKGLNDDNFIRCLLEEDIQLPNYQSHPAIKIPLSN